MISPFLDIDLIKIRENTKNVTSLCRNKGISTLGVTKGFSAIPQIVRAMIDGGVDGLADARMENIIELRQNGFTEPITLLRIPRLSNISNVVRYTDVSINSEAAVINALSEAAQEQGTHHQVMLMVDVGDLREGVMIDNVLAMAQYILKQESITLIGVGTNMGCYGGILPDSSNLGQLVLVAQAIEKKLGYKLNVISGGGTSTLLKVENDEIPEEINQLRIGEGILLGTDTTNSRKISWLHQDAFCIRAEVIELKSKPSVPIGTIGRDAFGNIPEFKDHGIRKRAILALGKQDVYVEGIIPIDEKIHILGASSDHLIVDVTDSMQDIQIGDEITFRLTYSGLLSASTSKYVTKVFHGGNNS